MKKEEVLGVLIGVVIILLILAIPVLIFWGLWNWIAVGLFGAPALSLLQAVGLWILLAIIGGFFKAVTK